MNDNKIVMVFLFIILTALTFSGCSSRTCVPPRDVPEEALKKAICSASSDAIFQNEEVPSEWWLLFDDPQLNACIQAALIQSPSLQSAHARILGAFYQAAVLQSSLFPYLNLGADVSHQKLSKTGVIPFNTGPPGSGTPTIEAPATPGSSSMIPEYFSLYETELNLSYEFDFWQKNRNTYRAALGQVQANIAEEAFARLRLAISVAESYFSLQTDYTRRKIAQAYYDNRSRYSKLVERRVSSNLDNELSWQNAEVDVAEAQDRLLAVEGAIAVTEYQLKALMAGNFDEEFQQINIIQKPLPKVPLPQNLPLHLIAQRPDIAAQLWLIESAGRRVQVAKAGFYPDFNLTGLIGYQTIHISKWFLFPSTFYNIDPAFTLPLFDGGRLVANLRGSEVNYDLAILDYNNLVIQAAEEVLEALAVLRNSWQRLKEIERKLTHQKELHRLTSLRVSHSLNNDLDELNSEANVLTVEEQEAIALGRTIQGILELIKSLGGGYGNCTTG